MTPLDSGSRGTRSGMTVLATVLIFALALNLRPALTGLGPLLPQIGPDEELSEALQGLLGSLPLLAFAAISPLVHRVSGRWGADSSVLIALVLLAIGLVVRSFTGHAGLWIGTIVVGCGIAVCNVLLPVIVRRDFPLRVSRMTSLYSACMAMGAAAGAGLAVPLSFALGWRGSLAIWAVPAAVLAVLWIVRARRAAPPEPVVDASATVPRSVWTQPLAWLLTGFFGLQSVNFYTLITWLPTVQTTSGLSEAEAGGQLFVFQVMGIVAGLTIPRLMRSSDSLVTAAVVASVPLVVAPLGLLFAPQVSLLWMILAGLGSGASLVVALALVSLRGRTGIETTKLSGMAQSVGYLLAAAGPIVAGFLAEQTGGWTASLLLVAGLAIGQVMFGIAAGRRGAALR